MFDKLDQYLVKLDDPSTPLDDKIKQFKNGMIRLKKIKKQINETNLKIQQCLEESPDNKIVYDFSKFSWIEANNNIQMGFNNLESDTKNDNLELILKQYLEIKTKIDVLEQYINTQKISIKKICDDYETVKLEDITHKILNIPKPTDIQSAKLLDQGINTHGDSDEDKEDD
jgi:exonuclease VII small subunit